jgi:hypothetical protein
VVCCVSPIPKDLLARVMSENPFEVTKAVDFTNAQIEATWVDLPGGGFLSLADPRSPMPIFLVGGKGGGRTHLLRYFSYSLQTLRHAENLLGGLAADGYLGIYFRCGGLNSSRFSGKRQDEETWASVFAYYMEVWLGRLTVDIIAELFEELPKHITLTEITQFTAAALDLFDVEMELPSQGPNPARDLSSLLQRLQRDLDLAINNAALTHELNIRIGASPGRLAFGIPSAASRFLPALSKLAFTYLLDEFENLTPGQQRYVNTLLREKELPSTFLIGSRLFGLRTHATLSAGEENRQGSEFGMVVLEDTYRAEKGRYNTFCNQIVLRRLGEFGFDIGPKVRPSDFFESPSDDGSSLEDRARSHVASKGDIAVPRPWMQRLETSLLRNQGREITSRVMHDVAFVNSPLHEKFAVFLLYRSWADGRDLIESVLSIRNQVRELIEGSSGTRSIATSYSHYRHDLYAQILNELRLPQEYFGFSDFVRMSGYLPRNLLVVLKQVTQWSNFLGEQPFRGDRVSKRAQSEGVREASAWFLSDAKGLGKVGEESHLAIRRLASLFREMRFSDKPVEVSCASFSTDRQGLTAAAIESLDEAVSHSLLLDVPTGRRDKNTHVLNHKYQLNPMIAPTFDLSLALRGSAGFSAAELNAIFDPAVAESEFEIVKGRVVGRMQAPFINPPGTQRTFEIN